MPNKGKKECAFSGCHQTTTGKHCEVHTVVVRLSNRKKRTAYQKGYGGAQWAATRQRVIARDGGICRMCGLPVRMSADAHIDHIVAVKDGGGWHDGNLQLLHKSPCHSRKTLVERRARGEKF